jgi:hypothetical protein
MSLELLGLRKQCPQVKTSEEPQNQSLLLSSYSCSLLSAPHTLRQVMETRITLP